MSAASHDPTYRPDIDGLRALAVLSVIGFHAFPDLLRGGFIGVDIFFVISGFLITGIILNHLERATFSFRDFYARRIRRIFPALILVLLACFLFGWFQLLPYEFAHLGKHIAAGAGFVPNFVSWNEAGYFDAAAESKPLLHLWSLGVEEQFYIFWPLTVYLFWKKKSRLLALTLFLAGASFALNVFTVTADGVAAFYSPLSRLWELMAGSALALAMLDKSLPPNKYANGQAAAGLALIIAGLAMISRFSAFPGWWAQLPTGGAALLILAGPNAVPNRKILNHRALVGIGLISYPLYLWHWPILYMSRFIPSDTPGALYLIKLGAILLSLCLSWLTYAFIEKPIRFGSFRKISVTPLVILMMACAALGTLAYKTNGFDQRFPEFLRHSSADSTDPWRQHQCFLQPEDDKNKFASACVESGKKPLVFLWGDSHAAALYPGLKSLQKERAFSIAQYTASLCPPLLNWHNPARVFCADINTAVFELIKKTKPEVVILHANWPFLVWEAGYDLKDIKTTIDALKTAGVQKIILAGPVPQWETPLPRLVWKESEKLKELFPVYSGDGLVPGMRQIDSDMKQVAKNFNVDYFSAYGALCRDDACMTVLDNGHLSSFDGAHLTPEAALYVVREMFKR